MWKWCAFWRQKKAGQKRDFEKLCFAAGFAAVLAMLIPYLILGTDSIVNYHDQLDGEMIAYILQARHLFSGSNQIPEFLNGASKAALTMPAPMAVLLFLFGNDFAAYVVMQIFGSVIGYLGMFLLAGKFTGKGWIAMIAGVLYAYLPFLPVYGLSQYGLPLLLWFVLELKEGQHTDKRIAAAGFCYGIFYAFNSSLVLVGFAVLGLLALSFLFFACRRQMDKRGCFYLIGLWLSLCAVYVSENLPLFDNLFGQEGYISHKAEYVLTSRPFWNGLLQTFLQGTEHSKDYHSLILAGGFLLLLCVFLMSRKTSAGEMCRLTLCFFGICGILCAAAAFWNSFPGIAFRKKLNALGAFQLERVVWLCPVFWYLAFACVLWAAVLLWREGRYKTWKNVCGKMAFWSAEVLIFGLLGMNGITVFLKSNSIPNLRKLVDSGYSAITYNQYYATDVMAQVKDYIREETGKESCDYRVASLGIDPAAALKAGFYCLDGYSNNYALSYKHAFREILLPELEKSDYLKNYFDDWGNRCYLLSAECPAYYTIEKNGFYFTDYQLNTEAFRKLGGEYILSAAYIVNAGENGLELVREQPFETDTSYYRIFLYRVL